MREPWWATALDASVAALQLGFLAALHATKGLATPYQLPLRNRQRLSVMRRHSPSRDVPQQGLAEKKR